MFYLHNTPSRIVKDIPSSTVGQCVAGQSTKFGSSALKRPLIGWLDIGLM